MYVQILVAALFLLVCKENFVQAWQVKSGATWSQPVPFPPMEIDLERVRAHGIDVVSGNRLMLLTDCRDRADVNELGTVFGAAIPEWCDYFGIDASETADWKSTGMIIADIERFRRAGLVPDDLPHFLAGFQRGGDMWVYLQPGGYYTRHLFLHEGTHAFMQHFLGGVGGPWYTEGMAELLALHSWSAGKIDLQIRLTNRSQAENWGRIKIIRDDYLDGKPMSLDAVFELPGSAFREVRSYAWSWAACEFLSSHTITRNDFPSLSKQVRLPPAEFNQRWLAVIEPHRAALDRDWRLFIQELDFGYDVQRSSLANLNPSEKDPFRFALAADRSWQATPISVQAGDHISLRGSGRFIVADEDGTPWPCESNGVTIAYYQGKPLGKLMAGVLVGDEGDALTNSAGPISPMLEIEPGRWRSDRSGVLCFRINESPTKMFDNQGQLTVQVEKSLE
jgi:hypothetical protein